MASLALRTQNFAKAEALYKRLFVSIQAYAPCSVELASVLREMAEVASRQGRLYEATKSLSRVRQIQYVHGLKHNDPRNLQISEQIANLYVTRGLYDDGCQEYDSIIHIFREAQEDGEENKEVPDMMKRIEDLRNSSKSAGADSREKFHLAQLQAELVEKLLQEPSKKTAKSAPGKILNDAHLKPVNSQMRS